ncbi:MAG: squalene--hopene cyclase [Actinomycetota bacterium]|nr:squalene--hopene cyclase [Actinomycetota bacterium]
MTAVRLHHDGGPGGPASPAAEALRAAVDQLLELQAAEGWWKGELETNVTMDVEDVLLRHFLGILEPATATKAADWIRSNQRPDGTWGTFLGAPGDVSATVEAYVALRLAGEAADAPTMLAAARWVAANGGMGATRVFTRIWLAMVGAWEWERLPVLPPEIMLLPAWAPLNIYDFGCWARQTIVALSVVMAHRPARPLPFALHELSAGLPAEAHRSRPGPDVAPWWRSGRLPAMGRAFETLDRLLHRYERLPSWVLPRSVLRRTSLHLAEQWIVSRQEADGCWGGIQPPLVYSVIALHLQGYALDHPVMAAAIAGMNGFVIDDERGRRIEACQSPVWDTALAVVALTDAGIDEHHPGVARAGRWLLDNEIRVAGDWSIRRPQLPPGGWAFEFANINYPDIDDTAEVVMALRRALPGDAGPACDRGVAWTVGLQCRAGGWGAFDVDNDSELCASLPFCDFGRVTDPPSSDVTAHVIEMLAAEPGAPRHVIDRAVTWLSNEQEEDGSWFGRWGVNHLYGTGAALPALIAAGVRPSDPRIRRAVGWLVGVQQSDGGWGEDPRSYRDVAWRGRGATTPSQTAWALLALLAAGEGDSVAVRRGIVWLVDNQTPEGTWEEPWFTGTGFPWDFTINYHLYRHVWPMMALGRYLGLAPDHVPGTRR